MKFEELGKGIVKRTEKRALGLFIDGTSLDRATRRISRKVDMTALVRGVTSGIHPIVARYYTLIPYEDDSRQRAFLDAVSRAGLSVVVKRLPPKGVSRQVSVDVEIAADIIAFALGHFAFSDLSLYKGDGPGAPSDPHARHSDSLGPRTIPLGGLGARRHGAPSHGSSSHGTSSLGGPHEESGSTSLDKAEKDPGGPASPMQQPAVLPQNRIVTVVCPSRDLAYPISLIKELGVDTVTADFGQFNTGDVLKSSAKWIDLSDSETIWRE